MCYIIFSDQGFHDGIAIETVVEYLAAHNDAPRILSQVISYVQQREGLGKDAGLRNTVSGILQALSHGSNYTRETVLTELSRYSRVYNQPSYFTHKNMFTIYKSSTGVG